jgi:hypothetical protein
VKVSERNDAGAGKIKGVEDDSPWLIKLDNSCDVRYHKRVEGVAGEFKKVVLRISTCSGERRRGKHALHNDAKHEQRTRQRGHPNPNTHSHLNDKYEEITSSELPPNRAARVARAHSKARGSCARAFGAGGIDFLKYTTRKRLQKFPSQPQRALDVHWCRLPCPRRLTAERRLFLHQRTTRWAKELPTEHRHCAIEAAACRTQQCFAFLHRREVSQPLTYVATCTISNPQVTSATQHERGLQPWNVAPYYSPETI